MEIRRATVEDARSIARVHVASWQAAYRGLNPELDVFVADDDGIVAFASASSSRDDDLPDHGELQTLYALRRVWSTGVGHALHDAVVDGLRGRGFDRGAWPGSSTATSACSTSAPPTDGDRTA